MQGDIRFSQVHIRYNGMTFSMTYIRNDVGIRLAKGWLGHMLEMVEFPLLPSTQLIIEGF
jgi:hypothetical protein